MAADRIEMADGLYMPLEQYLALDESTDGKYEYLDGYVFMLRPPSSYYAAGDPIELAGESTAHAAICANVTTLLNNALSDDSCTVYSSDAKVRLAENHYLYPDATVACGEQESPHAITTPRLIVEVLSPNTEKRDRGAKFKAYKTLASLQEYVLIGSEYKAIEVHRRNGSFWRQYHYYPGDRVELTCIDVSFSFDEVYRRVRL